MAPRRLDPAASLLGQKKYAEGEPLLLAGYEGLKHRQAAAAVKGRAGSEPDRGASG